MAEEQELEVEEGGGGSKKMIVIIGIVVLLAGGGGAAFFLMGGEEAPPQENAEEEEEASESKMPAIYVGVPEAIISPIISKKKNRMVQIKASIVVRSEAAKEAVKLHMPRLKSELLTLVSGSEAEVLITPEGRRKFQTDSLTLLQETMKELDGKSHIDNILFVSFVLQ